MSTTGRPPTTYAQLTALQVQWGTRRLGADCQTCPRTGLGINKPVAGSFAEVKLVRHREPADRGGRWCLGGGRPVPLTELRPLPGSTGERRAHHSRERGAVG